MKKLWKHNQNKDKLILVGIILFSLILFLPGFFTYFHQDDFLHMAVSQRFDQVTRAFNIIQKGEFPFYRPIPTQFYFYVNKLLFGYNPFGYHVVNFLIFSINTILVYLVIRKISGIPNLGLIGGIFYGINSTHVAPLYSPAYVHELLYVLFGLCTVLSYLTYIKRQKMRYYTSTMISFILALMTKETAVVLPGILLLLRFTMKGIQWKNFVDVVPFGIIEGAYLFAHFVFYGIAQSPSYQFIIGKPTINALVWYFLWALSVPNILIDFVGPGLKVNPVFFQVAGIHGWILVITFPLLLIFLLIQIIRVCRHKTTRSKTLPFFLLGISWFVVGLIPLLVFPLHHLATEQAFSLIGLSLAFGVVISQKGRGVLQYMPAIGIGIYLIVAVNSIFLARKTHWIAISARQARNVFDYLKQNHHDFPDDASIYFVDGEIKIPQYGSSKQIHQALGEGKGLNIIFNKPNLRSYYEFQDASLKDKIKPGDIVVDSSKLLGY